MQISKMAKSIGAAILTKNPLPKAGPYPTGDPYLFCVYHKDEYPAGNDRMEAPKRGTGHDFNPAAPYRMYHGSKVPGFPQHPHRGFETITATITGIIDHADSLGNGGRYGEGDLQWMTAGSGIVHSEMFPLIHQDKPNPTRFFQIWLNLPKATQMSPPSFAMFWANDVPKYKTDDGRAQATVWIGHYFGVTKETQNTPPPDSWANNPDNDVALVHIVVQPGGKLAIPKANLDSVNRSLFYIEGKSGILVDGEPVKEKISMTLDPTKEVTIEVPDSCSDASEFLWMQGKPIEERVVQYGPFALSSEQEVQQAFMDYRATQFGGWPWPRDDMVFDRERGRFALFDGKESFPSDASCTPPNKASN